MGNTATTPQPEKENYQTNHSVTTSEGADFNDDPLMTSKKSSSLEDPLLPNFHPNSNSANSQNPYEDTRVTGLPYPPNNILQQDDGTAVSTTSSLLENRPQTMNEYIKLYEGDIERRVIQVIMWILLAVQIALIVKYRSRDIIAYEVEEMDSGNSTVILEAELQDLNHFYKDSDTNVFIAQLIMFSQNAFTILRIILHFLMILSLNEGPPGLRPAHSFMWRRVIAVNPEIHQYNFVAGGAVQADMNYEGDGNMYVRMHTKLFRAIFRLYNHMSAYLAAGNVAKLTLVSLYILIIIVIATTPTFGLGDITYQARCDYKSGMYDAFSATYVSCVLAICIRAQIIRWKRRQAALEILHMNSPPPGGVSEQPSGDAATVTGAGGDNATLANDTYTSGYSTYTYSTYTTSDSRDESVSTVNQRKTTVMAVVAWMSFFVLIFCPVVKLEYSGYLNDHFRESDDNTDTYTLFQLGSDIHARSNIDAAWIGFFFYLDTIIAPVIVLSATCALKIVRYYDGDTNLATSLYSFVLYTQPFANAEVLLYVLFFGWCSVKHVVDYLVEEHDPCGVLDITLRDDEDCYKVNLKFMPGTYFCFVFVLSQFICINLTYQDLIPTMSVQLARKLYHETLPAAQ